MCSLSVPTWAGVCDVEVQEQGQGVSVELACVLLGHEWAEVHTLQHSALSPRLFSKAIEITRLVSEGVSPVSYVETLFICH